MPEKVPQLPVSEQEVQIQAPSFLEKLQAQKKKILIGVGVFFGVLILAGVALGVYFTSLKQPQPTLQPTPTPTIEVTPTPYKQETEEERVYCEEPRPEICTMECLANPPYICGSDGKSYCTGCQACVNSGVEWYLTQDQPCGEESCGEMSLAEVREIVLASECVEEGSLKETSFCNENTGTWWLDLDIEKEGCAPACVVNVSTKKAEINWRCTGLLPD